MMGAEFAQRQQGDDRNGKTEQQRNRHRLVGETSTASFVG
jgi:hypothetical protein